MFMLKKLVPSLAAVVYMAIVWVPISGAAQAVPEDCTVVNAINGPFDKFLGEIFAGRSELAKLAVVAIIVFAIFSAFRWASGLLRYAMIAAVVLLGAPILIAVLTAIDTSKC